MPELSEVQFPSASGRPIEGFLARPHSGTGGDSGPIPGLLVIHEIFGLNDDIRRITGRFAEMGLVAFAPNLYDGAGPRGFCVVRTLLASLRGRGRAFEDLEAARTFLAQQPNVDPGRLGVTGFCLGGGFAVALGTQRNYRVAAPFYGQVPAEVSELENLCPVVGGFGGKDKVFAPQGERLKKHLTALGIPHDVVVYPEAGHSYMSHRAEGLVKRVGARGPMRAGYDEDAAEDSWRRLEHFFREHLFEVAQAPDT